MIDWLMIGGDAAGTTSPMSMKPYSGEALPATQVALIYNLHIS